MALVALAIAWAGRAAADKLGKHTPLRKSHGHYAKLRTAVQNSATVAAG